MPDLESLGRLAEVEFLEIVQSTAIIENKLRVTLVDGSYIDFWWSEEISGRFAYHWERIRIDGTVYRHDKHSPFAVADGRVFPQAFPCRRTTDSYSQRNIGGPGPGAPAISTIRPEHGQLRFQI